MSTNVKMIKYYPGYKKENTLYIVIHNTGSLGDNRFASTLHLTSTDINLSHEVRFGMYSSLGSWIGYNFFIDKEGFVFQARAIGEETAAQKGWNFGGKAISICLAGNFTNGVDKPTQAQITALKNLIYQLPSGKIVPHRYLQGTTECFGSGLPDNYFENLIIEDLTQKISLLQRLVLLFQELKNLKKLSGVSLQCGEVDVRG